MKEQAKKTPPPTVGFGVPATTDPHHFIVTIPAKGDVQIVESLGLEAGNTEASIIERVVIDRARWEAICGETQRQLNVRLKGHGLKPGAWKIGRNQVDRLLGKELCVLVWAVEELALEMIPTAIRNWLALQPEDGWWLFGQAARGEGWRRALRHALGDAV